MLNKIDGTQSFSHSIGLLCSSANAICLFQESKILEKAERKA
jgi:hypothetical protein